MRFNGSMTSGASWTVFRFLRQYHVTERDFPSGYIYGAQRYGYVETTLVWYTSVYIYVLGYISVVPHTTTTPSALLQLIGSMSPWVLPDRTQGTFRQYPGRHRPYQRYYKTCTQVKVKLSLTLTAMIMRGE